MADRPEAAIQAILTGILNMQQLNLSLAGRLAVEVLLEGEPQGERDQLGGTRKEARAEYLAFTRDQLTFERGRDAGETSLSGSEGQPEITASRRSKPRGCCMTPLRGPLPG